MTRVRRGFACWLACMLLASLPLPARANDTSFPFGLELMLDVNPMPGTRRVPIIEIDDDGTATIDLWCLSTRAQAVVGDGTISLTAQSAPTPATQCAPELLSADQDLLAALAAMTKWQRNGDRVELIGTITLRFQLMTN